MINLHTAIYALNPTVATIRGDIAYDKDENVVAYDTAAAQAKLAEMQAAAQAAEQAAATHKESALNKLSAIGLTADEIKALIG